MGITRPSDPQTLRQRGLAALPQPGPGGVYRVAYSGGLDSTALLHMTKDLPGVCAVHVNHAMQTQADVWQQHCETQCRRWSLPLECRQVRPDTRKGGPEAAARDRRYAVLRESMRAGDVLLTAQHADDQAETFLLQALRGAGVRGLAAMPDVAPFGVGHLARPLLKFTRAELADYARSASLTWVEDPSNQDAALGRAALRQQVSPALEARWPGYAQRLSRAAAWCAQAAALADELARMDLDACVGPLEACLNARRIADMTVERQSNLLRYWIHSLGYTPPDHRHVEQILRQLASAAGSGQFLVDWPGVQIRGFNSWLFAMRELPESPQAYSAEWDMQGGLRLPAGCGQLEADAQQPAGTPLSVSVRFRQGGEKLCLNERSHQHSLKQLLQQSGVPGWVRARLPLLYQGGELVAVADYWRQEHIPRLHWVDAPPGAALPRVVGTSAFR